MVSYNLSVETQLKPSAVCRHQITCFISGNEVSYSDPSLTLILPQSEDTLLISITISSIDDTVCSEDSILLVTADSFSEIDVNCRM